MSIGADLLRFSNRKLIFFDFESSNVNLFSDNLPFQASWIIADRYKVYSKHDYYLKWPNYKISKEAAVITRFQQSWVDNGTDPEFVLDCFESFLFDSEYLIVGHNILSFDAQLHQLWRRQLKRDNNYSYLDRIVDTHLLSKALKLGVKPDRANLLAWQYKMISNIQRGIKTNLTVMAKELDVPVDEANMHNAIVDLEVNWGVYKKLINLIEI